MQKQNPGCLVKTRRGIHEASGTKRRIVWDRGKAGFRIPAGHWGACIIQGPGPVYIRMLLYVCTFTIPAGHWGACIIQGPGQGPYNYTGIIIRPLARDGIIVRIHLDNTCGALGGLHCTDCTRRVPRGSCCQGTVISRARPV
jgi:hypothetical protein